MPDIEIPVKQIFVNIIRCSFCPAELREDNDNSAQNQDYFFKRNATVKGWRAGQTTEKTVLTFCPDHSNLAKEMGILK